MERHLAGLRDCRAPDLPEVRARGSGLQLLEMGQRPLTPDADTGRPDRTGLPGKDCPSRPVADGRTQRDDGRALQGSGCRGLGVGQLGGAGGGRGTPQKGNRVEEEHPGVPETFLPIST